MDVRCLAALLAALVMPLGACGSGGGYVRDQGASSRELSSSELGFLDAVRRLDPAAARAPDRDLLTAGRVACTDRRAGRPNDVQEGDVRTTLAADAPVDAHAVVDASSLL